MPTPNYLVDTAKEQGATITSDEPGKAPFIVEVMDLERLLSDLRLRIHRFITTSQTADL
jgi:hypothetical protein